MENRVQEALPSQATGKRRKIERKRYLQLINLQAGTFKNEPEQQNTPINNKLLLLIIGLGCLFDIINPIILYTKHEMKNQNSN